MKASNQTHVIPHLQQELADTCLEQIAGAGAHRPILDSEPVIKPRPEFTQALGEDGGSLPDPILW